MKRKNVVVSEKRKILNVIILSIIAVICLTTMILVLIFVK